MASGFALAGFEVLDVYNLTLVIAKRLFQIYFCGSYFLFDNYCVFLILSLSFMLGEVGVMIF